MPRKPREISPSDVYHVMLRGVNKQRIFEQPEDYRKFVEILKTCMYSDSKCQVLTQPIFRIYAYCLMDNHVHLLIDTLGGDLGEIIKRIAGRYAQWFNWRYKRIGHLFQDRYKSTTCFKDDYFYTLLDYIHNNPVKAGFCSKPSEYTYSSFNELSGKKMKEPLCSYEPNISGVNRKQITDWVRTLEDTILPEVESSRAASQKQIKEEMSSIKKMQTTQEMENVRIAASAIRSLREQMLALFELQQAKDETNDAAKLDQLIIDTLLRLSGADSISQFQQLDKKTMRSTLARVRDAGISLRHLSRLTGVSEGVIRYSKNPDNLQPVEEIKE